MLNFPKSRQYQLIRLSHSSLISYSLPRQGMAALLIGFLICSQAEASDSSYYFRRALEARFAGQADAAIADYKRGLQIQPNSVDAHMQLGALLLEEKGDLDGAISEYMTAIGIDPGCATCESRLNEAMEIKNSKAADIVVKANLLYSYGQLTKSSAYYRMSLQIDPSNPEAHNALSWTLYKLGGPKNLQDAAKEVQEALKLKTDDAEYINTWACVLYDQGDIDGAIAKWRKAIANSKKPSAADLYGLAMAYFSKGDKAAALRYYKDAIATDPKYAEIEYVRDRIGMSVHTCAGHEQLALLNGESEKK